VRHFIVIEEGKDDPVDCYATERAAQEAASAFVGRMQGFLFAKILKAADGTICKACGMQVDDGLEAEEIK